MKDSALSYTFAAIGAVAGIVYLYQSRKPVPPGVTNVFPPLNTSETAVAPQYDDQLPTQQAETTSSPVPQKQTRPTYPIYYA